MRRGAPTCIVIAAVAACSGPRLSSTEQAAVVVTPGSVTFPDDVELGAEVTLAKAIRFSPAAGNTPSFDQITAIVESCADFTVTGPLPGDIKRTCVGQTTPTEPQQPQLPELPAHGGVEGAVTCQSPTITVAEYDVSFRPVTPGFKSCAVVFQGNFGQISVTVSGVAVKPQFAVRVSPTTINFGDVRRNVDSPPVTLSIQNTGRDPLQLDAIAPPGDPFEIAVGNGGGSLGAHVIQPDAVETYLIRCNPPDAVAYAGTVRVRSPRLPGVDVSLACTGTDSQLVGPPDFVDLIARQHLPIDVAVKIKNVGTATASISGYQVEGIGELMLLAPGVMGDLDVGAETEAIVRYTAQTEREHMSLGTLTVAHDTGKTTIPISGEARATEVGVDPAAYDFGPVCVGRSADRDVTVSANLAGHVDVVAPPVASGPLAIELPGGEMFPYRLEPKVPALTLTARFQPVAPERSPMAVRIATDAPMMQLKEIAMTGEGMPPGVGASPPRLDFGALDPGGPIGPGHELLLSNCLPQEVSVTGVRIEGPHANQFGIAAPADPLGPIAAFDRRSYLIVLSPGTPGLKEATIVFEHTAGATSVSLVGTTLGPGDRRESYYDCSAGGGGAAAWPIGLALAAVLRRRRTRPGARGAGRADAAC